MEQKRLKCPKIQHILTFCTKYGIIGTKDKSWDFENRIFSKHLYNAQL